MSRNMDFQVSGTLSFPGVPAHEICLKGGPLVELITAAKEDTMQFMAKYIADAGLSDTGKPGGRQQGDEPGDEAGEDEDADEEDEVDERENERIKKRSKR